MGHKLIKYKPNQGRIITTYYFWNKTKLGMKILVVEDGVNLAKPLAEKDLINNRNIFIKNYNSDVVLNKYRKLISLWNK